MKKFMLLAGVLGACTLSQALPLFNVSVYAGGVEQDPSGVVSYKAQNSTDYIDLKNDAHFSKKTQPYIGVRITNSLPILPNLKLDYMPMKFSGSGTLNRPITFGGITYEEHANFTLNTKINRFDVEAYYHLPFISAATKDMIKVRLGLNVRIVDFSESFTGTDQTTGYTVTQSKSLTVPIPMGHIGVTFSPIKQVSLVGDLNYVSYGSNNYYNYNLGLRLSPVGLFKSAIVPFVQAGYRYEKLKINQSSVYANVDVKGPYLLAGVEF
jgi:outer membrane protein